MLPKAAKIVEKFLRVKRPFMKRIVLAEKEYDSKQPTLLGPDSTGLDAVKVGARIELQVKEK